MWSLLKKLWQPKTETKIKSAKSYPLSDKELRVYFTEHQCCPDCLSNEFYEGPAGGISINIKCGVCGSFFNDSGPFSFERIHWLDHHSSAKELSGYNAHTPNIINNWHAVVVDTKSIDHLKEMYDWCAAVSSAWSVKSGYYNSEGLWSVSHHTFFFKEKDEAINFKLSWV